MTTDYDGGDGHGCCLICDDTQEGYPCLHTADECLTRIALIAPTMSAEEEVKCWRDWFARVGKGWEHVTDIEGELTR